MDISLKQAKFTHLHLFFFLSFLLHLLFFASFYYFNFTNVPEKKESYYYSTPAYAYMSPPAALMQKSQREVDNKSAPQTKLDKNFDLSEIKIAQSTFKKPQTFADITHPNTQQQTRKYEDPIRMIGEKLLDDPFQKLLGRAITRSLYYPQMAKQLYLKGIVSIGFTIHPDGRLEGVRIVKKSREKMLDQAALHSIQSIPPIANVDLYLKQPRYLEINIIY